jgi:hypothetical protein
MAREEVAVAAPNVAGHNNYRSRSFVADVFIIPAPAINTVACGLTKEVRIFTMMV